MKRNYIFKKKLSSLHNIKGLFLAFSFLFLANFSHAQITVTNPSNATPALAATYTTLNNALTALNTRTAFTGPIVITVDSPSYTETAPAAGFLINYSLASSSLTNNVIIDGNGASFTANAGLTAGHYNNAIIKIKGSDFLTIQNFKLYENNANTTGTLTAGVTTNNMTEWGIAILYNTATDGSQNITLKNNTIDLNRLYANAIGIYANATHIDGSTGANLNTTASATSPNGGNNNLTIIGNTVTDVNQGISIVGPIAAVNHSTGLVIGNMAFPNTITNFGNVVSVSPNGAPVNSPTSMYAIHVKNYINYNVDYNNINTTTASTLAGASNVINIAAYNNPTVSGTVISNSVSYNTIAYTNGASTPGSIFGIVMPATAGTVNLTTSLNINNNNFNTIAYSTSATVAVTLINHSSVVNNLSISGNRFNNLNVNTSGNVILIQNNNISTNVTIDDNKIVTGFTKTVGGTFTGYNSTGITPIAAINSTITYNDFSNVSNAATYIGIRAFPSVGNNLQVLKINNNTLTNITVTTGAATGITLGGGTSATEVNNNTIGAITGQGNITGIQFGDTSANIGYTCKLNKIYSLNSTVGTTAVVTGISTSLAVAGSGTNNIYNNYVGDLSTAASALATTPFVGVSGIFVNGAAGTATNNLYNNTVFINNFSNLSTNFSSNCVYYTSATANTLLMQNNLLVNRSTVSGTGRAVALQFDSVGTQTGKYASASNNNSFWGTTGLSNNGTNAVNITIANHRSQVGSPRDSASQNINPTFVSLTGTSSDYLHLDGGAGSASTLLESGGLTIAVCSPDLDGTVRPGPTGTANGGGAGYDIGADEFDGIPAKPVVTLVSNTPSAGDKCTTNLSRTIIVNVVSSNPLAASNPVTLSYSFNGATPVVLSPTVVGDNVSFPWTFVIPAAVSPATIVTWSVTATDNIAIKGTYTGVTYRDQSTSGITATAVSSNATLCAGGSSTTLTATFASSLAEPSVATASVTNATVEEDISNVTILDGTTAILNNTSAQNTLVGSIGTAAGTTGSYANYSAFGTPSGSGYPVKAGNSYNFSVSSIGSTALLDNAFAIYIDYNKNGVFTDAGERVYASAATTINSHTETGSFTIPTTAAGGKTRMRVIVKQGGVVTSPTADPIKGEFEDYTLNIEPAFASFSWNFGSAGGTAVGTATNPNTITGAVPGTYYITATDYYGCTVVGSVFIAGSTAMSSPVAVTAASSTLCNATTTVSTNVTNGCLPLSYNWSATGPGGAVVTFTPNNSTSSANPTFAANLSGSYVISCVITGFDGDTRTTTTTTVVNNNPTPTVNGTPYSNCGVGTFSLSATPSTGANILNWYPDNLIGTASVGTGTTYVTPSLSSSTTYYVEEGVGGPATGVTGTGSVVIGTSSGGSGQTPFSGFFESQHTQYLITAADLTAAGLTSGNITSMSLNVSTKNSSHTLNYVDYTVKMGNAGSTSTLSGFLAPTFTTVYGPSTYTTVSGTNSFTFTSNYNWNGVDNIVLDVCYSNDPSGSSGSGTSWSSNDTVTGTTKSGTVVFGNHADNTNLCGTTGGTSSTGSVLPNFTFSGQSITCRGAKIAIPLTVTAAPSLTVTANQTICNDAVGMIRATTPVGNFTNYVWSPITNLFTDASGTVAYTAGQNAHTVYVRSTTASTQTYTLTATNGPCTNTGTTTVIIMPQPTISSTPVSICVSGTPTLSLSSLTGYTGGTIQWQVASVLAGPYSDISGANSSTYTPAAPLTATTYYKVVLKNSAGSACTAITPITITVDSPAITSTTPATRCGTGTASLEAVSSTGIVKWYAAATGGSSLYTGSPFTTPIISSNTTYYAESASAASTAVTVGPASPTAHGGTIGTQTIQWDVNFTTLSSTTLTSIDIFPVASGQNCRITVRNGTGSGGTIIADTGTFTTTVSGGLTPQTVLLNASLPTVGNYAIYIDTMPTSGIKRNESGSSYPYTSSVANITSNGFSTAYFMGFFNWQFGSQCVSSRTAVLATVTAPPALTLSTNTLTVCNGSSSAPVTLTSSAANFNTYTWSPATGVSGDSAIGWVFNPTTTTTYTLTGNQTSGSLCANINTVVVTVNPGPTAITVTPTSASACPGKVTTISYSGGGFTNILINENFNSSLSFPANWTAVAGAGDTVEIVAATTSGGTVNQIRMTGNSFSDITNRAYYGPINSTGATSLNLSFNSFMNHFSSSNVYSIKVQTSTDGITWRDSSWITNPVTVSQPAALQTVTLNTVDVGSPTLYVSFTMQGETFGAFNWNIDNILLENPNATSFSWSPTTNLFIDNPTTGAATPYDPLTHLNQTTVYAKPTLDTVYTATSTAPNGCFATSSCTISTTSTATYTVGGSWTGGNPDVSNPNKNIVIEAGSTFSSTGDLYGCSCTIGSGANVTINSGHNMIIQDKITVDPTATITFNDKSSLVQVNTSTTMNTGNITYKRTTSTLANNYDFVYWGSPVTDQLLRNMWMTTANDTFYTFDPTFVTAAALSYEGWRYASPITAMIKGKGYISRAKSGTGTPTWTPGNKWTANFIGVPNNGDVSFSLVRKLDPVTNDVINRDNLLANPYPSAIDIIAFQNDAGNNNKTTKNYYFWSHFTPYNGTIYQSDDYAIINGTTGVAVGTAPINNPSGQAPDRYVPAGQAFFVEALSTGIVRFKNVHRVANFNDEFYKTSNKISNSSSDFVRSDKVWLNFSNHQGVFKQIALAFADGATSDYDLYYEAKTQDGNTFADFYTYSSNVLDKLTIQSRAPFSDTETIKMGYKTTVAGDYWIEIDHSDPLFVNNQKVYLQDNLLDKDYDLTAGAYKFRTAIGEFNDRFVLKFKSYLSSGLAEDGVLVANKNQTINVRSFAQKIDKITVYDLVGRLVFEKEGINSKNYTENKVVLNTQTLILKITMENGEVVTRKIVFE